MSEYYNLDAIKTGIEKDIAINTAYQSAWGEYSFSYSEAAEIESWFAKMGRRYGLLREFRENCIC